MTLPSIHDADAPNAMVNAAGERFFPDSAEDAAYFAEHHGARYVLPAEHRACRSRTAAETEALAARD